MGLLGKLFGKKDGGKERREAVLAAVREATTTPMGCEECLKKVLACFTDDDDHELRLDAVNALFELERTDYADALARHLLDDAACPAAIQKGLLKHFLSEGRADDVLSAL